MLLKHHHCDARMRNSLIAGPAMFFLIFLSVDTKENLLSQRLLDIVIIISNCLGCM